MPSDRPPLTQARLKELLHYDPETGVFTWRVSRGRLPAGSRAGTTVRAGYVMVRVDGRNRLAHRLAFLYMTGALPGRCSDHVNRSRADNRWVNLRPATHQENEANKGLLCSNTSGYRGVSWCPSTGRWRAYGKCGGKSFHLGRFSSVTEAAAAAQAWREEKFGVFAKALS